MDTLGTLGSPRAMAYEPATHDASLDPDCECGGIECSVCGPQWEVDALLAVARSLKREVARLRRELNPIVTDDDRAVIEAAMQACAQDRADGGAQMLYAYFVGAMNGAAWNTVAEPALVKAARAVLEEVNASARGL